MNTAWLTSGVSALAVCLLLAPVFAADVQEDPIERQMLDIAKDLRCTVCQNQPIAESNADLARDMRDIIREQIKAGKSREQIMQFFVERYGNYVLMKPPVRGRGALLWLFPGLLALVLGVSAYVFLKRRRGVSLPPPPTLSQQDIARVHAARERENR